MRQPPNLSEREPIMFILFLALMAVLLFGGRQRRHAYDAAPSATDRTDYNSADVEWQKVND